MEYGAVRQIAIDDNAAGSTKKTFLIRDDAYSKASAVLGRTLRLGDPIDTGPSSAIYQTSWSGGFGQNVYSDTSMFYDSNMNTTNPLGLASPWGGYTALVKGAATTNAYYSCIYAVGGVDPAAPVLILGGSGGTVSSVDAFGVVTSRNGGASIGGVINVIAPFAETGSNTASKIVMGTSTGKLYTVDINTWTFTDISHPTITNQPITGIVNYKGKLVVLMGNVLYTRDAGATWVAVYTFNEDVLGYKIAVNGNTIYVLTSGYGPYTKVYASDTVTTTLVYTWKDSFGGDVLAHNGLVYFYIKRYKNVTTANPSLYMYNGASMKLIHDRSDSDIWGDYNQVDNLNLAIYNGMIAFSYTGGTALTTNNFANEYVGFMLYNPTNDSIHHGPSVGPTGGVIVTAMTPYRNGIAFAIKTGTSASGTGYRHIFSTNYSKDIAHSGFSGILGGSLSSINGADRVHFIRSSNFDSNLPSQDKVWMNAIITSQINGTYSFSIDSFADVPFCNTVPSSTTNAGTSYSPSCTIASEPITISGFPSAKSYGYTLRFTASSGVVDDYAIQSIAVRYLVSPTALKVWRIRVLCSDGQETLGGATNSLATADAQTSYLYNLWANGRPFYYWEPQVNDTWFLTSTVVVITDYLESSFRIDTETDEVVKEISLTLYQVQ
jgi:hypothetical protein